MKNLSVDPRITYLRTAYADVKRILKEERMAQAAALREKDFELDNCQQHSRQRMIAFGSQLRDARTEIEVLKAKLLMTAPLDIPYHVVGTRPPQDNAKIEGRTYE